MYYEINVSLNGTHYFATAERSIQNKDKLKVVLEKFIKDYPEANGYKISITEWEKKGLCLDIDEILEGE